MTKEEAKNNILSVLRVRSIENKITDLMDDIGFEKDRILKDRERVQEKNEASVKYIEERRKEIDKLLDDYLLSVNFKEDIPEEPEKTGEPECGDKDTCVAIKTGECDDCGSTEPSEKPNEVPAAKTTVDMSKNKEGKYEVN